MFSVNYPPDREDFIKLLHYSHCGYWNTEFYDDDSLKELEECFCEGNLPLKEHKDDATAPVMK